MPGKRFKKGILWGRAKSKATEKVDVKHRLEGEQTLRYTGLADAVRIGLEGMLGKTIMLHDLLKQDRGFTVMREDFEQLGKALVSTREVEVGLPKFNLERIVDRVSDGKVELKKDMDFFKTGTEEKYQNLKGLLESGHIPMFTLERDRVLAEDADPRAGPEGEKRMAAQMFLVDSIRTREGKRYVKVKDINHERWDLEPEYEIPLEYLDKDSEGYLQYLVKKKT